jgi:hypothetical protein
MGEILDATIRQSIKDARKAVNELADSISRLKNDSTTYAEDLRTILRIRKKVLAIWGGEDER